MSETCNFYKLSEVTEIITDGSHNPPKGVDQSDYLMLSSRNIFNDKINVEKARCLSKSNFEQEDKRTNLRDLDVLLTIVGTIGRAAVFKADLGMITLQRSVAVIRPIQSKLNSRFLMFSLQSMLTTLLSESRGVAQQGFYLDQLRNLNLFVPSLEKQREIVEKLDAAFAEIEQLSENSRLVLGSVTSLLARLIDTWIKSVSSGKTVRLGDLAELKGRIGWRGLTAKEYTKSGPLFLSVHSLNHGHFVDFSRAFHISKDRYDESPEIHLKEGYILIAKDGAGLGKVGMVGKVDEPTTVNSSLLVVKPNDQVKTKYLYCYFLSSNFKELIKDRLGGSTVPHLYQRDIVKIPVVLLPPEQQAEFIEKFDVGSKLLEGLAENLEKRNRLILELKSSILSLAFEAA